jgi:hypothetical protein
MSTGGGDFGADHDRQGAAVVAHHRDSTPSAKPVNSALITAHGTHDFTQF